MPVVLIELQAFLFFLVSIHLVEKGTDVTMIQKLLGNNSIRTTLIYLHTSNKDLLKIVSPLDDLALR